MRPIPHDIRAALAADPFMERCIFRLPGAPATPCAGRIEWEHAVVYAGRQVNETWAIVPCCTAHHRGRFLRKRFNLYVAILRADPARLARYPRTPWERDRHGLAAEFPDVRPDHVPAAPWTE
jgi:hypothetical protein